MGNKTARTPLTRQQRQRIALGRPCVDPNEMFDGDFYRKVDVFVTSVTVDRTGPSGQFEWHVQLTTERAVGSIIRTPTGQPIPTARWDQNTKRSARSIARRLLRGVGLEKTDEFTFGDYALHFRRDLRLDEKRKVEALVQDLVEETETPTPPGQTFDA